MIRIVIMGFFIGLLLALLLQIAYFYQTQSMHYSSHTRKQAFVSLAGLPDLALVSEAHFVRHRSLSDTFAAFSDGPELLEYFPSTFVYKAASLPQVSKIDYAN